MSNVPIRKHEVYADIRRTLDKLSRMSPAGKVTSQILEGLIESWLEYYPQYDDLRSPSSAVNPPGAVSDPDIDPNDGAFLFGSGSIEILPIINQMPHSWKRGTFVYPHIHWTKTSDAAGDVIWEYKYRIIQNNAIAPAWSSWIAAPDRSYEPGSTQMTIMDIFPILEIPVAVFPEINVSAIFSVVVRRNTGSSSDTYGADAKFWEFDIHVLNDSQGSTLEISKGSVGL